MVVGPGDTKIRSVRTLGGGSPLLLTQCGRHCVVSVERPWLAWFDWVSGGSQEGLGICWQHGAGGRAGARWQSTEEFHLWSPASMVA